MKTATTAILFALAATVPTIFAQDIENNDIPTQCATVCSNIVTVSDDCDRAFERDSDELACMCQAEGAQQVIPLCAACIAFYDDDEDDRRNQDNDAGEIMRDCRFSSTSYDPSITYSQAAMTAVTSLASTTGSGPGASVTSATGSAAFAASASASQLSSDLASATGSAASSVSSALSSLSSAAASATATGNVGAVNEGGKGVVVAGVGLLAAAAFL